MVPGWFRWGACVVSALVCSGAWISADVVLAYKMAASAWLALVLVLAYQ